ncbi:MAG: HTTM domain-containing protein [Bacteroidota bacterium]
MRDLPPAGLSSPPRLARLGQWLTSPVSIAPLASFRVLFGGMMALSVLRFTLLGWIDQLYVQPSFHFTFYGFGWVAPLPEAGMYAVFAVMGLAAVGIMLGWQYRVSAIVFFLTFTYVELIDKTNYLNHYYFVSIVAFVMVWLPAHRSFSIDALRRPDLAVDQVPRWTIDAIKLQVGIVYVFAGLAKLHPDWLLEAMPLRLWLPAHSHLPIVGPLLTEPAVAYLFSWGGMLFDTLIPFFLLWGRTRLLAFVIAVGFHAATAVLFPIGVFPYVMVLSVLVFFPAERHERVQRWVRTFFGGEGERGGSAGRTYQFPQWATGLVAALFAVHFAIQLLLPVRFAAYPGNLFWTEQGYRFSWRVMLMEKAGHTTFEVRDPSSGRQWEVANYEHLTLDQERMMAMQPDMILQFAHYIEDHYQAQGIPDVEVRARALVTLNARPSQLLIDPSVDLTEIRDGLGHKWWVRPFEDDGTRWVGR